MAIKSITVNLANADLLIPWEDHDKVLLRLVAERNDIFISQAWVILVDHFTRADLDRLLTSTSSSRQVSMVLIDPFRLNNKIFRMFSQPKDWPDRLEEFICTVSKHNKRFAFIVMEILEAETTGIAVMSGPNLVAEVGFGHFIAKGVVDTTAYVFEPSKGIVAQHIAEQRKKFIIEGGVSREIDIAAKPRLTMSMLTELYRAAKRLSESHEFANCAIEYGVLKDGTIYLIDVIRDKATTVVEITQNTVVMSPGAIVGQAVKIDDPSLVTESLDAHFHSSGSISEPRGGMTPRVFVARRPFLALEQIVLSYPSDKLGFVFEGGSILCHLAIVLRERGVPAVIVRNALSTLYNDDLLEINTSDLAWGAVRVLSRA